MKKILCLILAIAICVLSCACGEQATVEKTTAATVAVSSMEPEKIWNLVEIVDDFGDSTGEYIECGTFVGTYSNSNETDSYLEVVVYVDCHQFSDDYDTAWEFQLFEHGNHKATYTSGESKILKIKVDGNVHKIDLYEANGSLLLINKQYEFLNILGPALVGGKDVACVIQIGDSTYRFTITAEGYWDTNKEGMALNGK